MAVVDQKAPEVFGITDADTRIYTPAEPTTQHGNLIRQAGTIDHAADDSNGSRYAVASIPSHAILDPASTIDLQSWGYAAATVGTADDDDALLASVTISGLGAASTFLAFNDAKWNKPFYEQLGMTDDPGGDIVIYIHTAADATGTGDAAFEFHYWV